MLADAEAWQARDRYPDIPFGGPVLGVAREREQGRWDLHPYFRKLAGAAEQSGDQVARQECTRAAERMTARPVDEMTVLGTRYRVVRADRFTRIKKK